MSLLRRLRNYRQDATYRLGEEDMVNRNEPPTFVPDLITGESTNRDDLAHLEHVANGDPLATYIVWKLAENTLDDWFTLKDAKGNVVLEDAQRELTRLQAKRVLTQTLAYERTFGYAYLYTGKNRYVPQSPQGGKIAALHPFTPRECVVKDYNEVGEPVKMEVTVNVGEGEYTTREQKILLDAKDFIIWNTRPVGRGYTGRSALYSIWDDLTYIRYIKNSMCQFDMKIGVGLFTITTKTGIPDDLKSKLNTSLEDISVRRAFVVDGAKIEKMEWLGPGAGATDFQVHIDECLKQVAAGTGVPKDVLIGATAGAITGSEVNVKSLFATLNQIQTSIEPYIRELIRRMGYPDDDYDIAWNARYAHDEEEQSKIAMNNAQTLAIRSKWMTINEIREEEGLPPREDGDRLSSDFEIGVQGMQTPDEREKTNNPDGENL